MFQTQKIMEAFDKKEKVLSLSFHIQAAFDAVWHGGLIRKMQIADVPEYIVEWTRFFLAERSFEVNVGYVLSESCAIVTGVPQGSSISPILFSIFINDIPIKTGSDNTYSLSFADDLTVLFVYSKITLREDNVSSRVRTYLSEIERWLCKWRMKMAPSKCNYSVFSKGNTTKNKFGLKLFGEMIPHERHPVSLGVTFDESLNFKSHIKKMKAKCNQRMNIIKILSHRSWKLKSSTLVSIYNSLVGSVLDYSAFMYPGISDNLKKSIQAIQNNAMRLIFERTWSKVGFNESTNSLCVISGLPPVGIRMEGLNTNYFRKAVSSNNDLIKKLQENYTRIYNTTKPIKKTLLCYLNH